MSFPCSSKWRIESSMESWQEFAPHLSATQMDLPSLSISTALVEPHVRPSGSFAQSVTVWYALGNEFVGCTSPCACAVLAAKTANTPDHMAFILCLTCVATTCPDLASSQYRDLCRGIAGPVARDTSRLCRCCLSSPS